MKKLNIVFAILLIIFSVTFYFYADTFRTLPGQMDIGPAAFPKAICIALIVCAILLIATEVRKENKEKVSLINLKLVIGVVTAVVYFLLLQPLGFVISSILAVAVMMLLLLNEPLKKAWPLIVIVAIAAPVTLQLIFGSFLKVPLPAGILEPFLG